MCLMRITVISGGRSGARFVRGLLTHLDRTSELTGSEVTVIANTGDDITLWGVRICPDLDLLLRTLGGDDAEAGDVVASPEGMHTNVVRTELAAYGLSPQWFPVSDEEIGTHLARTALLGRGETLTEATATLAERWRLAERGVRVLPMSDVPVETHAVLDGQESQQAVHVQQWRHQLGRPSAARFVVAGMDRATPAPGVLDAIRGADLVLMPPSDPVLSLGIVLGVPGVRDALRGTSAPVVGVSPVAGGRPDSERLAASLAAVGVEATSSGIAGLYRDLLAAWLVDPADAGTTVAGVRIRATELDAPASEVAAAALDLARSL